MFFTLDGLQSPFTECHHNSERSDLLPNFLDEEAFLFLSLSLSLSLFWPGCEEET